MERRCEVCEKPITSKSPRAKFCSSTCRSRAHRSQGQVVSLPGARAAQGPESSAGQLELYTRKQLEDAGRVETILGQAALDLARRIDARPTAQLNHAATAHRELRMAVAEAMKGAHAKKSSLQSRRDELAARREKRQGGA